MLKQHHKLGCWNESFVGSLCALMGILCICSVYVLHVCLFVRLCQSILSMLHGHSQHTTLLVQVERLPARGTVNQAQNQCNVRVVGSYGQTIKQKNRVDWRNAAAAAAAAAAVERLPQGRCITPADQSGSGKGERKKLKKKSTPTTKL